MVVFIDMIAQAKQIDHISYPCLKADGKQYGNE